MRIQFHIKGNHEKLRGNALPKLRKTARQQWTPQARRYVLWKEYVSSSFMREVDRMAQSGELKPIIRSGIKIDYIASVKPLDTGKRKVRMDIKIHWANGAHGDPENVFGSIADAIFSQDKFLIGSFDYVDDGEGYVEVTIDFGEESEENMRMSWANFGNTLVGQAITSKHAGACARNILLLGI